MILRHRIVDACYVHGSQMTYRIRAMWRASLLSTILPFALAACTTTSSPPTANMARAVRPDVAQRYAAPTNEKYVVDAVDTTEMDPKNLRQVVDYPTTQQSGTIVVDPHTRFLYLVMENGRALRYGVGVGKAGLEFSGTATVQAKKAWPRWTPTSDMIRREPARYRPWAKGMEAGAKNPLGARALYLFKNGKDTLYRIHGTTEPGSIGKAVSSGCIRMLNQDVIDLYNRVPKGAKVVVL